jgi:hypothetical protein
MKTKKRRIFENQISNEYAVCVTERDDWGNKMDRVITTGSKEYCENWVEDYCRQYSWNRGMHDIKPVTEVDNQQFKRDYFGNNDYEDDFADLEDMLDNVGVSVNRRDIFGENKNKKNMKKNTIRLTENELKNIITESVKNVLKENYNPVQEGIMNFHSDMNALRSDIDEIIEGIYDRNARERLRMMDKKLAQIGAEFAKIESTLEFLGNQN